MSTAIKMVPLALFVLLLTATNVSGQARGVELSLNSDMVSLGGNGDRLGTLVCRATGNDVTLHSVSIIRVKTTGESTDLLTATSNSPANQVVSPVGFLGNGTLENNRGYIFLDQMDAAICDASYFLCEALFTEQSGEKGRVLAAAWPGQAWNLQPGREVSNNGTLSLAAALERRMAGVATDFEMLNRSFSSLLESRKDDQEVHANITSRIAKLEKKMPSVDQSPCPEPCSNISQALEHLERRLKYLESLNVSMETPKEMEPIVCERGMNETVKASSVIVREESLGREIRCDAHTDGGGWIIILRRAVGGVDFNRNWNEYRDGFGSFDTDFWLGNEAIHNLTNDNQYELRIDVVFYGQAHYAQYTNFSIEDEANRYRLHLSPYREGTIEEAPRRGMATNNGMVFSTYERDGDLWSSNCASSFTGGWWYAACTNVLLTGSWRIEDNTGIRWYNGYERRYPTSAEMKIRRRNDGNSA